MGKIKKLLESELIGGTHTTEIYPITSTKAVFDSNNKSLDKKITELESRNMFDTTVFTGGYQSTGIIIEDSTRCHTSLINGVESITASSGYQVAALVVEDGRLNTEYFTWVSHLLFEVPKSVKINIKKTNDSNISIEEAKKNVSISLSGNITPSNVQKQIDSSNTDIKRLEVKINETVSLNDNNISDLTISDESGNILAEFADGHFRTKEFDSRDVNSINPLKNKIVSFLGDSISTFGVPDQNNATGTWTYPGNRCRYPQSNLLTNVNLTYWKRLIDNNGMVLGINESWAGSRVSNTQPTDSGDFGPNRCISSVTRISHLGENGTPDYIVVYAGTNDAGGRVTIGTFNVESPKDYTKEQIDSLDVSNFANAYRAMLIRLMYYYPTSKILVLMPNFTSTYYTIENLDKYIEIIKEECDFFGIPYLDLRTCGVTIFNYKKYLPDGIHPNADCMELIYIALQNKLKLI